MQTTDTRILLGSFSLVRGTLMFQAQHHLSQVRNKRAVVYCSSKFY